jgi:branched-chain amino acid transport system substrate-binding protein
LIEKVASLNADILFIPGWDENVGPMLRQAEHKWDKFKILGGDGLPTDKFIELSGGNLKEVYALAHYDPNSSNSKVKTFVTLYKQKYGYIPSPHAALGYDAIYVLYKAIEACKTNLTPVNLNTQLKKLEHMSLITGIVDFQKSGNVNKTGVILKINSRGYELVDSIMK